MNFSPTMSQDLQQPRLQNFSTPIERPSQPALSKPAGMIDYESFIAKKAFMDVAEGFADPKVHDSLFDFQKAIVTWALRKGRAAIFADTGLGKTRMQLSWLDYVISQKGGKGLILAPLAVSSQTVLEAESMGIDLKYVRDNPTEPGLYVTNYEMMPKIDMGDLKAIVLDESSIIKHHTSKFRNRIIDESATIPFRLSCTATPSPNDFMELGNQAEFVGIMGMSEMLAMFFTHDSGETSKWRLKGHGQKKFWEWLSTWAAVVKNPADIGFDGSRYVLPTLNQYEHIVPTGKKLDGALFASEAQTLSERNTARRITIEDRVAKAAEIVNASDESWIVWCNLNDESKLLTQSIPGAVEIKGSDKPEYKEEMMRAFSRGEVEKLVTKPSIAGFGMNWQHCRNMAFVGLNDSFEQLYQAIRRCWRFGQEREVNVHVISSDLEGATLENIKRKERQAEEMTEEMAVHMADLTSREIKRLEREKTDYIPQVPFKVPSFLEAQ